MRLLFEQGDRIKLINITDYDNTDWGLSEEEYNELARRSDNGDEFEIVCQAVDDYYDVIHIESGTHYAAVSDYHIVPNEEDLRVLVHQFS